MTEVEQQANNHDNNIITLIIGAGCFWFLVGGPTVTMFLQQIASPEYKGFALCAGGAAWLGPYALAFMSGLDSD